MLFYVFLFLSYLFLNIISAMGFCDFDTISDLFLVHFFIICVFEFGSLENVILVTPTMKSNVLESDAKSWKSECKTMSEIAAPKTGK